MASAAVDTAYLANFCAVPETNIKTLTTSPTADLVTSFLQSLITKAQEHEFLKSDRLRLDVELENAVRGGESRVRGVKATADKALKESDALRRKLHEEETQRNRIQDELQSLKSSSSTSTEEVEGLRAQVTRLETSNRETLSLLDSKSIAHDKLAENLASQHQKTVELRREISGYHERLQTADNDASSARFKESSLQQEIELLKRNNDWLNSELQTKSGDYSKYRKDKSAKIAELQRTNEELETNLSSARRTETSLRQRLDEVSQKLDDAFSKIQLMTEESARTEESFRAELDNSRRLAELQKQSAETAKGRVEELDELVDQTKADASEELGQTQAELETERTAKEAAEQRVEELEMQIERLESNVAHAAASSRPETPVTARQSRGLFATPGRVGSPALSISGNSQNRGGTYTQLYSELNSTKAALEDEKRRSAKFSATIEEMIDDLDKRAPEVQELKMENARMEADVSNMSKAMGELQQEKDALRKEMRKAEGEIAGFRRQEQLLRHQLRDRDSQVKFLAVSVNLYEEGVRVNELQREQLQQMALGDFSDEAYEGLTDTDRLISKRFVVFRSISELQETNAKLLNLTRQLGEQMEGEEAKAKQEQQKQARDEIATLRDQKERLKDQVQSLVTQSNSFVRERDMFRRMLEHRKQIPRDADLESMFGESINGAAPPQTPRGGNMSVNGESPAARDHADQMKLVKEMQLHFDAYKQEAATDHSTLRSQIDKIAKEKGELQGELARVNSQLTLARERYEMLQSNFNLARSENEELQKRSRSLEDAAVREDMRSQQTAEDLLQARESADALRGDNAILKAEKDLSKRIEARLNEDNRNLTEERSRLNRLISDAQSLSNQRELSDSETRRRLENQVESLDSELRTNRRKLEEEVEASKKLGLRREFEQEQSRTRLDELTRGLNSTKEEMIAIKTTRDQLQARVDELKIDLRNAQEHAQALQPRPTPRPAATSESTAEQPEDSLNREQELGIELADLRRELELTKGDLENANAQVEEYKNISQASEESLNNLQETHEQYIADMDKSSAEKDEKITELGQRIQDISSELTITNDQLSELRSSANEHQTRLSEQQSVYDAEVARLKAESERHEEAARDQQEYVKAQAEIALSAQQSYDNELQKHAEAAKALQQVRTEYNAVKLEVSSAKSSAEAAQATIARNEESWATMREQYEHELLDLKQRRDDVGNQNKLLHQQLESVSTQITALQQKQAAGSNAAESEASTDSGLQNLQEVIKYLRREKEIVDVQYELSVQESRRLKQQLDYSQSQLDESRLKLDQERQRQTDKDRNSASHSQMVETLNQINVYRESNASLREDARRARSQLEDKTKKIDELLSQIQPLQTSLRELENNYETSQGEIKLLMEDRDRWQKRTQDILQKYDRVDPAELEGLKNKLEALEQERHSADASKTSLQQQLDQTKTELSSLQASIEPQVQKAKSEFKIQIQEQFKQRSRELSHKIKETKAEADTAREELEANKKELEALKKELNETSKARDEAVVRAANVSSVPSTTEGGQRQDQDTTMEEGEEGEIAADSNTQAPDVPVVNGTTAEASKDSEMQALVNELSEIITGLRARIAELEAEAESSQTQLAAAQDKTTQDVSSAGQTSEEPERLAKLQTDLEAAQAEVTALRDDIARTATATTSSANNGDTAPKSSGPDVDAMRAEIAKSFQERMQQAEEEYSTRVTRMKDQLNQKLRDGRQKAKDDVQAEHEASLNTLRQEHAATVERLMSAHAEDVNKMKNDIAATQQQLQSLQAASKDEVVEPPKGAEIGDIKPSAEDTSGALSPHGPWTESKKQVTEFVNNTPMVKTIVTNNIKAKVEQERENGAKAIQELEQNHSAQMAEVEQANVAKMEELQQKADKSKQQAVEMENKKWKVKSNMVEQKQKTAQAKVDMVEQAATDTPEKPVLEVWLVVKDFKLKPAPAVQSSGAAASTTSQTQIEPSTPGPIQSPKPLEAPQTAEPSTTPSAPPPTTNQQSVQPSRPETTSEPAPAAQQQRRLSQPPQRPPSRQRSNSIARAPGAAAATDKLPQKPPPSQAGTGPAALRGLMQGSGLPRATSGNAASSIRGGAGRGNSGTAKPNADGRASLPDGPLSSDQSQGRGGHGQSGIGRGGGQLGRGGRGNAAQHDPHVQGNKRPRRDSSSSETWGSGGKRPRGGYRGGRGH